MSRSYDEWEDKINSTDTEKLTEVQEELTQAKNDGDMTEDEYDKLIDFVKQRLGGFNL